MKPGLWMVNRTGKLFEISEIICEGLARIVFPEQGRLSEYDVEFPDNWKQLLTYIGEV